MKRYEKSKTKRLSNAKSKFEYWVFEFGGVEAVGARVGVTGNTVYNWLDRKTQPNLVCILRILKLAPNLTLKDIAKGTLP